ncbi:magnesium transporter [Rhodobacterales bacterium LSUCC1028]|jgi:magnesium transporter|uniref:magnesium transporter n=1 Tax=unclassified Roseobacter TaxID=196798 RepID=UPI001D34EBE3|nr:magnesium transporter [Rhodobacterales bacterium HKCCA1058]MBF9024467.1 magnesium transporter [Rhodobacterales bacterium HKCCD6035]MBF9028459.1 magnesium transporter [Rhodobacterales bacterium FZCC0188]MBF9053479.1 magnesium transporter [Rhodobacterales bacterium LSUCC1028]
MLDEQDLHLDDDRDAYALDDSLRAQLRRAVSAEDVDAIDALMEPLHPADIADILEQISSGERAALLALWSRGIDGEVLSELDWSIREDILPLLPSDVLADAVRELDSDDVVDLVEDLEEDQQGAILGALDDADRVAVEQALSFPEGSAGRLMQREVVRAPEHWNVGQMIDYLRSEKAELPEQFYHIILVTPAMKPVGYVSLGRLLSSARATSLKDILEDSFRTIPAKQDEDDVAYAFNQYHLISAPVVDDDGRLVGVITIDDAMSVLDEVNEEDLRRLAGLGVDESLSDTTFETVRQRFPWLFVNLGTAILASVVIAQFEAVIAQLVALAVLMPIVASMGGNAGTQSLALAVRGLATRDLTSANLWRVVMREAGVGALNGLAFALVMGVVGYVWFDSVLLGGVIAGAMVVNLVVAGLAGILIPVALERFGADPALASGTFVTTVTDVVGFFAFLGLAALVLI